MKFYEFNDYAYYGLVVAENEDDALIGYSETIADIEGDDLDKSPDIISQDEALLRYLLGDIEGCETEKEKTKDFFESLEFFERLAPKMKHMVLLIDGGLK